MMKTSILPHIPPDHPWRSHIHWFDTIDSTNLRAKEMAAEGAPEGTVLVADSQSAGRGRLGRSFLSPQGQGIYLSVILRPQCAPTALMHLTCAAAVAMCDAVEKAVQIRPGVKWINDLVLGNRKLAGILTELSVDPKTGLLDYAVVGIGINCNQVSFPEELQSIATSLLLETGKKTDRAALIGHMICALERMRHSLLTDSSAIMDTYRKDCITIGKEICVHQSDTARQGTALNVLADGALLVQFASGETKPVQSGEVSVRGLFGYV